MSETVSKTARDASGMSTPAVVDFPLRGEWVAPNTPGSEISSHGTDMFGARYAYDFVGLDPESQEKRFYQPGLLHYLIQGVRLQDWYGWGRPIFSVAAGTVVQAEDSRPERNPVHPIRDSFLRIKNAWTFNSDQRRDFRTLSGNFVIVETSQGYAVYVHAQTGSIVVSAGDKVAAGQHLANVGHSGNSTAPHLHFQLMDHPDPRKAQGLPCCFRDYEVLRQGVWQPVQCGIPLETDRIRKL